jgi:hypothetical protein
MHSPAAQLEFREKQDLGAMLMTDERAIHENIVDEWLAKANGSSTARLLDLLEASLRLIWTRARRTLGDRTLGTVVGRVLYTSSEFFPFLGSLRIGASGIRFEDLRAELDTVAPAELLEAVRFVMTELLDVLGHLTGGILTPALHAELLTARVGGSVARSGRIGSRL